MVQLEIPSLSPSTSSFLKPLLISYSPLFSYLSLITFLPSVPNISNYLSQFDSRKSDRSHKSKWTTPMTSSSSDPITPTSDPQHPKCKQIFILSGQSNMSGRGGIHKTHHNHKHWDGIIPTECQSHPSILRLNSHLHWEQARVPLHHDIDSKKVCGIGPGMSFANKVIGGATEEEVIGLVPCAVGGTAIREWARGEELYERMVRRAKVAVEGTGGVIKGLLWYQGESDTMREEDVVVYKEKMERLVFDVREDLGLPLLPIIQVAITSGTERYIEKIREAQLGIKIPNVICIDAKGLPLRDDNLHLTTEAQVILGHMFADAYLAHFHSSSSTSGL